MAASREAWLRFVLEESPAGERKHLQALLDAGDPGAEEEVRRWRQLLATMAEDSLLTPPDSTVEAAVRAFRRVRSTAGAEAGEGLLERVARLVFDSLAAPEAAFAGARSAASARRLRFEGGGLELDLLVEPEGDIRRLTAQLLVLEPSPAPLADARWVVLAAGVPAGEGETDDRGELVATLARSGSLEVRIAHGDRIVVFRVPDPRDSAGG
jgi:hypothetical protein